MTDRTLHRALTAALCITALALAACEFQKPVEADPAGRAIPQEICRQLEEVVADVRKKTGMEFEGDEAIIEDAVWRGMSAKDRLAQALAYRLACAANVPPLEQSVTIRNEWGVVLMRRLVTIETRDDEDDGRNAESS